MRILCRTSLFLAAFFVQSLATATEYLHCQQISDFADVAPTMVSGRIVDIDVISACSGQADLVVLTIKAPKEDGAPEKQISAYLAPNSYLMQHKLHFALGDDVEITGVSVASDDGAMRVTATQVSKAGRSLALRDRNGRPLWKRKQLRKGLAH